MDRGVGVVGDDEELSQVSPIVEEGILSSDPDGVTTDQTTTSSIFFAQTLISHGTGVVAFGTDVEDTSVLDEVDELFLVSVLVIHALVGFFEACDLLELLLELNLDLSLLLVEVYGC